MPAQRSTSIFNKFQPICQDFSYLRPELPVSTARFGTSGYRVAVAELLWWVSCGAEYGRFANCPDGNLPLPSENFNYL